MYELNQIEVPESFMALYARHGRPTAPRATVEQRYEMAEDLAAQMSQFCSTLQFKDDLGETEVLRRCHAGLLAVPETVTPAEAAWVTARAAELLEWAQPAFLRDAN